MFKEFYKFVFVISLLSSFSTRFVEAQCPLCGFRAAYWLRNELAELNCGQCASLSGNEKIFGDVELLLNKSSSLLKNGKLNLHGPVGYPGTYGVEGPNGDTGSTGVMGQPGMPGSPGLTGFTGPTGPRGVKGSPGISRIKRQANSASKETLRKKISPFLSNCSEVSDYFLSLADQIDEKRSNKTKPNLTENVESQSLKNLTTRYDQVKRLYEHVVTLFNDARKEVESDPRYKGATGATGHTGPKGMIGNTGWRGPDGYPGGYGSTGAPGYPGAVGPTGNTGPSGAP